MHCAKQHGKLTQVILWLSLTFSGYAVGEVNGEQVWQLLNKFRLDNIEEARDWVSEYALFSEHDDPFAFPGSPATTDRATGATTTHNGAPLITFIHYNHAAARHIQSGQFHHRRTLQDLYENRQTSDLPALPKPAQVALTGWWPVGHIEGAVLPVWKADAAQLRAEGSNTYLNWQQWRYIHDQKKAATDAALAFAGRTITHAQPISIDNFIYLKVSADYADRLMKDANARDASLLVLGRPLEAGDYLALIALHIMSAEIKQGLWTTFWWQPTENGRENLPPPWRHFAMDWTTDPVEPREIDGSPNICFNPWFDAVFADTGAGNGLTSNCLSCHLRAAYPFSGNMAVSRGEPSLPPHRLQTALLWSLANPQQRQP